MHVHIYMINICVQKTYAVRHSLQLKIKTADCLHKNFPYFVFLKTVLALKKHVFFFSDYLPWHLLFTPYKICNGRSISKNDW